MNKTHRLGLACAIPVFAAMAAAQTTGRIVVNNDEWTLANAGFAQAPDAAQFATNVAAWFTGSQPGQFLVYSNNFGLTESSLASTMTGAGHSWTIDTMVAFDVPTLLTYDAVFVAGSVASASPNNTVLINYVESGGSVYVAAGTDTFGGAGGEATAWNQFLNRFGLAYDGTGYNTVSGTIPITAQHAIFANVQSLYFQGGNDVLPHSPGVGTSAVLQGGLFGVVEAPAVTATFTTNPNSCIGLAGNPIMMPQTMPIIGTTFTVDVIGLAPPAIPFMVMGFSSTNWAGGSLPYPITQLGPPTCDLLVSPDATVFVPNVSSMATWNLALPNNFSLLGLRFFNQCIALAPPTGISASNLGDAVIGNV